MWYGQDSGGGDLLDSAGDLDVASGQSAADERRAADRWVSAEDVFMGLVVFVASLGVLLGTVGAMAASDDMVCSRCRHDLDDDDLDDE